MILLTEPDQIEKARLLTLRAMLKLEILGMHRSKGSSAYTIVKKEFSWKGNKQSIFDKLNNYIEELA
jgi:hypothetical protein